MSDSLLPHGLQPTRLLHPWDFPGKSTGVGCHFLLQRYQLPGCKLCWSTSLYVYLKDARDWIVNILITKKKWELCDGMEVLVNALVGIILPYITVSNQHAQLTSVMSIMSQKIILWKNLVHWRHMVNFVYLSCKDATNGFQESLWCLCFQRIFKKATGLWVRASDD